MAIYLVLVCAFLVLEKNPNEIDSSEELEKCMTIRMVCMLIVALIAVVYFLVYILELQETEQLLFSFAWLSQLPLLLAIIVCCTAGVMLGKCLEKAITAITGN